MFDESCSTFVSSGAFKSRSVKEIVGWALDTGIHHIELGSGTQWVADFLSPVRATAGRPIRYLFHNYFPPHQTPFVLNLAAADPETLTRSREHCRLAVDLSAELEGAFFSVHAGFAFAARPEQLGQNLTKTPRVSLEKAHGIFVASLRDLCAYAARKNIRIAVENNVIAPFNLVGGKNRLGLCASAEDILRTYREVGCSNLGFLIDVGHLKVTANSLGFDMHRFLDDVASHVLAFHFG